jgi:acyl phosphate:glycerol-3-phosphate acyltransferase
LTGYVSLGSLTAAVSFPAIIWIMDASGFRIFSPALRWVSVAIGLLLIFTHRKNVMRLYRGTENRFSKLAILRPRTENRDDTAGG